MKSNPVPAPPPEAAPNPAGPLINRGMSAGLAGRAVVAYYLQHMLANEAGTIAGRDPEALHDMRVATRRLRAALRAYRTVLAQENTVTLNAEARWLALLLGHVRDLDVFLEWLAAYAEERPGRARAYLDRLAATVVEERVERRRAMLAGLRSLRYTALKQALADFAAVPGSRPDAEPGAVAFAERAIRAQMRATRRRGGEATFGDSDRLHTLRIAAKRLRYTCEFSAPLFPGQLEPTIAAATAVQNALGAMRDAQLQRQRVLAMLAALGGVDKQYTRELARVARVLRRRARREFAAVEAAYLHLVARGARRRLEQALARAAAQPQDDET